MTKELHNTQAYIWARLHWDDSYALRFAHWYERERGKYIAFWRDFGEARDFWEGGR